MRGAWRDGAFECLIAERPAASPGPRHVLPDLLELVRPSAACSSRISTSARRRAACGVGRLLMAELARIARVARRHPHRPGRPGRQPRPRLLCQPGPARAAGLAALARRRGSVWRLSPASVEIAPHVIFVTSTALTAAAHVAAAAPMRRASSRPDTDHVDLLSPSTPPPARSRPCPAGSSWRSFSPCWPCV